MFGLFWAAAALTSFFYFIDRANYHFGKDNWGKGILVLVAFLSIATGPLFMMFVMAMSIVTGKEETNE